MSFCLRISLPFAINLICKTKERKKSTHNDDDAANLEGAFLHVSKLKTKDIALVDIKTIFASASNVETLINNRV